MHEHYGHASNAGPRALDHGEGQRGCHRSIHRVAARGQDFGADPGRAVVRRAHHAPRRTRRPQFRRLPLGLPVQAAVVGEIGSGDGRGHDSSLRAGAEPRQATGARVSCINRRGMLRKLVPRLKVPHLHLGVSTFFRKPHKVGARPGTLILTEDAVAPTINVLQFGPERVEEGEAKGLADIRALDLTSGVTWIDVQGLGDERLLRGLAECFNIHRLALEDLVNVPQLPKMERYEGGLLWVTRMMKFDADGALDREQLGVYITDHVVITFQERPGDILDPVRNRIRLGLGEIRTLGPDCLAYALLDTVVDGYYPIVDRVSQTLEDLDSIVMEVPGPEFLA